MTIQTPLINDSNKTPAPLSASPSVPTGDYSPAASQTVPMDPTGAWTRWLRQGGLPLIKDVEVMQFLENIKKTLNNLIQKQTKSAKRASDAWKKSLREHH
jgi:hypothetical protein